MDKHSRTLPSVLPHARLRSVWFHMESMSTSRRQLLRYLCLATVCLVPLADTVGQQNARAVTVSTVPPALSVSPVEEPSWKSSLNGGRRDSVSDLLEAEKMAVREIDSRDLVPGPSQNRIASDLEARQREREASYRQMREQLQRMINQTRMQKAFEQATPTPQQEPDVPVQAPVEAAAADGSPVKEPTDPPTNQTPDDDDAGSAPPTETTVPTPLAASATDSVFADSLSAESIVDGPVDRIGLADSLYALDELSIALEMYGKVDLKNVAVSERFWVSFQRACCLRKLNRIPEAQEVYRRLAGQQNAGWLAKMSRWWLDQIDARVEMETQVNEYKKTLTALKESSDDRTEQ